VKLAEPVTGIRPSRLNTLGAVPDGTPGTVVGHGLVLANELGLRNEGKVVTTSCPAPPPPHITPQGALCWLISGPYGPPGSNSTICNGDSGGPIFVDLGGGPMLAGVASGILALDGITARCIPPQYGVEAPVDPFLSWIQSEGGADLANLTCGDVLQAGDAGTSVAQFEGRLDALVPEARHSVVVPDDTADLRVTMVGASQFGDATNDFDLYVKAGAPPSTIDFDCASAGTGQFAGCAFAAPVSGTWHVLVHRKSGAGSYQVTATGLGRDCTAPGADGLACNDLNPCSTADVCQSGVCAGTIAPDTTPCDDGDQCSGPDVCASGTCAGPTVGDGTPCDDGDRCSLPDTCIAGICTGVSPAAGCTVSTTSGADALQLKDDPRDRNDAFAWTWSKGGATPLSAFGDPTTATDYAVCIYDEVAGVPERILAAPLATGAGWRKSSKGFQFKNDRDQSLGGMTSALLRSGPAGEAGIKLRGKTRVLGVPDLPLVQDQAVTVQLVSPTACWQSTFGTSVRNDDRQFQARAD
jgi:hypothetical protein